MRAALSEPLPDDPLPLAKAWLDEAQSRITNAGAMTLATVDPDGRPSARMVICRGFDVAAGWLVFYTDRDSMKGRALAAHPWASCVFHWASLERQLRVDGPVTHAPDTDADAYWQTRPLDARIAAVASAQSQPLASRADLLAKIGALTKSAGAALSRPVRWGGYRVWAERVELWVGQPGRAHDRARWTRPLTAIAAGFKGGAWSSTRLQP